MLAYPYDYANVCAPGWRHRALSTFVRRGLIHKDDAVERRAWGHDGGFSVDGSVRIEGARVVLSQFFRVA